MPRPPSILVVLSVGALVLTLAGSCKKTGGPCESLNLCECGDRADCQAEVDGCICPCEQKCSPMYGKCDCACGGGKMTACRPKTDASGKAP